LGESAKGKEWRGFSPEMAVGCGGLAKNDGEQCTMTVDGARAIIEGEYELPTVRFEWRQCGETTCHAVVAAALYSGGGE
jgi:hypothetical protein